MVDPQRRPCDARGDAGPEDQREDRLHVVLRPKVIL